MILMDVLYFEVVLEFKLFYLFISFFDKGNVVFFFGWR